MWYLCATLLPHRRRCEESGNHTYSDAADICGILAVLQAPSICPCVVCVRAGTQAPYWFVHDTPPRSHLDDAASDMWKLALPDVVEQLMRIVSDETLVYNVARASSREQVLIAIGEIVPHIPGAFHPHSPVSSVVFSTPVHDSWRDMYPPSSTSLFAELELLRCLSITSPDTTPLHELLAARMAIESDSNTLDPPPAS